MMEARSLRSRGSGTLGSRYPGSEAGSPVKPVPGALFVDHRGDGHGFNVEMRWEAMRDAGYLTPNELFFVRSHSPTPQIDPAAWSLRVEGPGVRRPLALGYADLLRMPRVRTIRALECAGNGRALFEPRPDGRPRGTRWGLGAVGVAEWTGVPLVEVLQPAGISERAYEVMAEGLDEAGVRRPLPVSKALARDTMIAYEMNGEPLPPDHGFPARLLVPGWAAVASIKWLGRLYVSEEPMFSYWNTEEYVLTGGAFGEDRRLPVTEQCVKSALELPWPATVPAGRQYIRGRSWSPGGRVVRVEYSLDGAPWQRAALEEPNVPGAWVRWHFQWDAPRGEHAIEVRATDDSGRSQPAEPLWNDLGYLHGGVVGHPVAVS